MNESGMTRTDFTAFAALEAREQDFVLAIVHGETNGGAAAAIYPELSNPRDKGMRLRQRQDVQAAIAEVRAMREAEQDLSRPRMVDELLLLRDRVRSKGESPKHLELELRIIQELNKMAGHITQNHRHEHIETEQVQIIYHVPSPSPMPLDMHDPNATEINEDDHNV